MRALFAILAAAMLAGPALAQDMRPYIGISADIFASDIDPQDYAGVWEGITEPQDGTGAAVIYAGVRYEGFGIEAGWNIGSETRWKVEERPAPNVDIVHEIEVETGGPYVAGTFDVYSLTDPLDDIHLYLKGGLERAHRWTAKRDGVVTASEGSGVAMTGGGGARLEIPTTGLELRAELLFRFDDPGTGHLVRLGTGWRF